MWVFACERPVNVTWFRCAGSPCSCFWLYEELLNALLAVGTCQQNVSSLWGDVRQRNCCLFRCQSLTVRPSELHLMHHSWLVNTHTHTHSHSARSSSSLCFGGFLLFVWTVPLQQTGNQADMLYFSLRMISEVTWRFLRRHQQDKLQTHDFTALTNSKSSWQSWA